MKRKLLSASGFLAAAVYLVLTAVAFYKYPTAYSPVANWLSDLGNPLDNPLGAFFYNLGVILTALILIGFYLSMQGWGSNKSLKVLTTLARVSGILSSIFLIVTALFPLGLNTPVHQVSGKLHIFFTGFFLTFSATCLVRYSTHLKWIGWFGFFSALINFIYGAFLYQVFIAEWVAIGLFIAYVLMISVAALFINRETAQE